MNAVHCPVVCLRSVYQACVSKLQHCTIAVFAAAVMWVWIIGRFICRRCTRTINASPYRRVLAKWPLVDCRVLKMPFFLMTSWTPASLEMKL